MTTQNAPRIVASIVALALRRAGFTTSYLRKREGIRVKQSGGDVRVSVDYDYGAEKEAVEVADELEKALTTAGYRLERKPGEWSMYVTGRTKNA